MPTLDAIGATSLTHPMTYFGTRLSENITRTPEGYLVARNVPIARTGWQTYRAHEIGLPGDDEVRVWRDASEVFSTAAIASGEGKPVTFRHSPVFLTPENYNAYLRGHGQFVRASDFTDDGGERLLLADLYVVDAMLINEVLAGTREVSVGYSCDYEPMGGDAYRQTNIRINHFAVVPQGRAGSARINDAALDTVEDAGKDGSILAENNNAVTNDSPVGAINVLKQTFSLFRELGLRFVPTRDEESEAVERNEMAAKKGEERSERRNEDSRRMNARDAEEEEKEDGDDWHRRVNDLEAKISKLEGGGVKATDESEEEEEEEEEAKKENAEDCDLIPVETLPKEDRPKNPIPGAPQTVDALKKLRPVIAKHGTKDDIVAFNRAMSIAKGRAPSSSKYGDLLNTVKPDAVRAAEMNGGVTMGDAAAIQSKAGADFEASCKKYHRKNPNEVVN